METINPLSTSQEAAKYYLSLGWSLLPMQFLKDEDGKMVKKPMVKWKDFQYKQPTIEEVTHWLEQGWFLGIITGKVSGIVIVDDDRIKHGLDPTTLKSTIIAKTKSGGTHYYYKYDREIRNSASSELYVDIRGEGGYCVLPPFNGYEWISPPTKENIDNLLPLSTKVELEVAGERKIGSGKIILSDFEVIKSGERNATIHKLACSTWNNSQLTEEEKISQIKWLNETRCVGDDGKLNPLSSDELEVIINQARTFVDNNPKTEIDKQETFKPSTIGEIIDIRVGERELEKNCPSTGLSELDSMIKGFVPKHLYALAGSTNVGKTSVACFFACAVAVQKRRVLYLALEPDTGVVEYIASIINNKRFDELNPETDYNFRDLSIDVFTKGTIKTPDQLIETIKSLPRYDLIIVDHVGYFVTGTMNTFQVQADTMKKLAEVASSNHCSVIAISHINKPDNKNRVKPRIPTIYDLTGSGAMSGDATDVLLVYRKPDPDDITGSKFTNEGLLIVGKSKNSASGPIPILFGYKKAGIYAASSISNSVEDNFIN